MAALPPNAQGYAHKSVSDGALTLGLRSPLCTSLRKTSPYVKGRSAYVDSIHGRSFQNIDQHSLSNRKIINNYSGRRGGVIDFLL